MSHLELYGTQSNHILLPVAQLLIKVRWSIPTTVSQILLSLTWSLVDSFIFNRIVIFKAEYGCSRVMLHHLSMTALLSPQDVCMDLFPFLTEVLAESPRRYNVWDRPIL